MLIFSLPERAGLHSHAERGNESGFSGSHGLRGNPYRLFYAALSSSITALLFPLGA